MPLHESVGLLVVIAAAFTFAGFVKGIIGLGLPTVGIGILGLWMTPAEGAAIVLLPAIVTNIWQCTHGGGFGPLLRRLAPLLIGLAVGTFIGVLYLPSANSGEATTWLGAVLALYAVLGLSRVHFSVPPHLERWLSPIMGLANGALTVSTGVFAIPQVPYIHSLPFERDKMVQALGLSFITSTVTMAAALGYEGNLHVGLALPSVVALGAALVGMPLGRFVRRQVRPETFRLWFFIGLLLLGLHLALRTVL